MREIKFRAWDGIRITTSGIMFNTSLGIVEVPEGSQMKLMQYTGLKDKNGKEIYEGDVIKQIWYEPLEIWFEDGGFLIGIKGGSDSHLFKRRAEMTEIIGNIYENPELLK